MSVEILSQGAEGKLYIGEHNGQRCLVKERFVKKYRHPDLDTQLTKERLRAESKAINRCIAAEILVPKVYHMDLNDRKIYMEYFEKAITVKHYVNNILPKAQQNDAEEVLQTLGTKIGKAVGKMHSNNIIHGDLTTSNMLLNSDDDSFNKYELIMIDFGLAHYSQSTEDKGVDLYVLERALLSTHSSLVTFFDIILAAYKEHNPKSHKEVVVKFEAVRARGRKRTMVG